MKFLVDQNANYQTPRTLNDFFNEHSFDHAYDKGWGALKDVALFAAMRDEGYGAILTRDRRQLVVPEERAALRQHGIHWIGFKAPSQAGLVGLALETSTILSGLPYVIAHLAQQPMACEIRSVPHQLEQRVKIQPL